jgi:hypothetical protein
MAGSTSARAQQRMVARLNARKGENIAPGLSDRLLALLRPLYDQGILEVSQAVIDEEVREVEIAGDRLMLERELSRLEGKYGAFTITLRPS